MARWTVFCRTTAAQILENASACVWPSGCNSRRVAALPVPASLLARLFPLSTPGAASRLTAEATPHAEGMAAAAWQFPELLGRPHATSGRIAPHGGSDAARRGHGFRCLAIPGTVGGPGRNERRGGRRRSRQRVRR